jgi:proteasome lid subunit RPN8/RPN11
VNTSEDMPEHIQGLLKALAAGSPGREICGFIMVDWEIRPITNVAKDDHTFDMDVEEQLNVFVNHKPDIVGVYHSHPSGSTYPSDRDIWAAPHNMRYWIVTQESVTEWVIKDGVASTVVAPIHRGAKAV